MSAVESINTIYLLTADDVQSFAEGYLGRHLSDEEMSTVKKCVDWGLSTGLGIVFRAAIDQAVTSSLKSG